MNYMYFPKCPLLIYIYIGLNLLSIEIDVIAPFILSGLCINGGKATLSR